MRRLLLLLLLVLPVPLAAPAAADTAPSLPHGVWPLQPRPVVLRGFDPPSSLWGPGHRGVDLRGRPGELVHASAAGTISFAAPLAGRGVVVVDHGTVRTTYEPVAAVVAVGDRVARGQVIGRLEVRGSHCFPVACLHWGLRRGEEYLDPLLMLGEGPIRLLPERTPLGSGSPRFSPSPPMGAAAAGSRGSGARVRLLVGPAQAIGADVGIQLCRRQ